jgi:hypothetical protein
VGGSSGGSSEGASGRGDEVVIENSTADAAFEQKEIHRFRVC